MRVITGIALSLLAATPCLLPAQEEPSVLGRHQFELGIATQSIRRTLRYADGSRQDAKWGRLAAFLRLAVTNTIAFDLNGLVWHRGSTDQFPNRDYFDFSFGAGLAFAPYRRGPTSIALTAHFHDLANFDQSAERFSKRSRQVALAGVITRTMPIFDQRADIWIGPVYLIDWVVQYPPFDTSLSGRSLNNAGAFAGASVIVARRIHVLGQITYTDTWQAQTSLSLVL